MLPYPRSVEVVESGRQSSGLEEFKRFGIDDEMEPE